MRYKEGSFFNLAGCTMKDLELKYGIIFNDNIVSPEDEGFLKGEYEFSLPLENPPWKN